MAGKGVLAIWNGIAPEAEDEFVAWHMREHIPERVAVPGFLRGRRYVAERGTPKYFNFYEVEAPDVLTSRAYLDRLDAPSDWTRSVVRHFTDTSRTVCSIAASAGLGDGAFVATLRLAASDRRRFLAGLEAQIQHLQAMPGVVAAHLLEGAGDGGAQTAEKALRSQPDQTADWILLIEGAERPSLDAALDAHAGPGGSLLRDAIDFDADRDCGIYRLQYGLARQQLP